MNTSERNVQRAVLWSWLGHAFRRDAPVEDRSTLERALPAASRAFGLDATAALAARAGTVDPASAYDRLFGHTVRGPCPTYEGEYGEPRGYRFAHEIGDLQGFYAAFGLRPARRAGERADHIGTECEFYAFLALKEACAEELHGAEKAERCREARARFLREHLGRFAPALAARVRRRSEEPCFVEAAKLLEEALKVESEALGVEIGPDDLGLRADAGSPEDACISCSASTETPR
ncbi:MAG: TorD/DmsD family molecular chaperone [Planctomycetaceae bacterium]